MVPSLILDQCPHCSTWTLRSQALAARCLSDLGHRREVRTRVELDFPAPLQRKVQSWTTPFHLVTASVPGERNGLFVATTPKSTICTLSVPLFLYCRDSHIERESLRESLSRTSYPPPTPPSIGGMSGGEAERERGCPRRALFVAMTPFHSVLRGGTGVERDRGRRALFVATVRKSPVPPILPLDASRTLLVPLLARSHRRSPIFGRRQRPTPPPAGPPPHSAPSSLRPAVHRTAAPPRCP